MGGHAAPRAGRALDGSEGSHERRLERAHSAGEEGWYVCTACKLKEGRQWNARIVFGWTNAACYSYGTSSARFLRDPDFGMTYIATLALILTLRPPAYWIAFGPHGPRAEAPPGENVKIFMYVMAALGATGVIFGAARFFARGQPATMTKEYQEATNDYLKVCILCEPVQCP